MRLVCNGEDSLGKFRVDCPGHCGTCHKDTDAVVVYTTGIWKRLKEMGVDRTKTPSLLLKTKDIGVTCGCYAKFQRQVAHIAKRQKPKEAQKT